MLRLRLPEWLTGDVGSLPGLGRSSGGGNGNPLQYSFFFLGCTWSLFRNVGSCGLRDLVPRPGIEPRPPALECRVLATQPPGKSALQYSCFSCSTAFPLFLHFLNHSSSQLFGTLHSDGYIFPFLLCLSLHFFSQLFVGPSQTIHFAFFHFFFHGHGFVTNFPP